MEHGTRIETAPAGGAALGGASSLSARPWLAAAAAGLALALLVRAFSGADWTLTEATRGAVLAGGVAALATALGALPALLVPRVAPRTEDVLLGFGAGVMLAAAAFSLIVPSIAAAQPLLGGRLPASLFAALALACGVLFMIAVDRALPHEHLHLGRQGASSRLGRAWLLAFAMLIHNFPEGVAIGVAFSGEDPTAGLPVAAAIAIQDAPEGLVVALALRAAGCRAAVAVSVAAATGLAEPLGAVAASTVLGAAPLLHPFGLAAAAGAMLFVVSHEIIPEAHRNGHPLPATLGVTVGFAAMTVLDNAFA